MMMMLDAQYSVEIKSEHHLTGKLQEYGLVVIPGWEFLEESFQQELMDYAERGGNLLLLGPGPLHLFGKNLPVEIVEVQPESIFFMGYENQMGSVKSQFAKVKSVGSSSGRFYDVQDFNSRSYPASVLTNYGNGKIGSIFCNLGNSYINERVDILKAYFSEFVEQMYAQDIKVTSSGNLHVHLTEKDGKQYLHLLNAGGPHNNPNVFQYDLLEKIHAIEVKYQIPQRPTNLTMRPENTSVPFQYNDGWVSFTIPEIEIYSIIEID